MDRAVYNLCRGTQHYVLKWQICVREYLKNFFPLWGFDLIPDHGFRYGVSRPHSWDTPHPVGILWMNDQPDAENSS